MIQSFCNGSTIWTGCLAALHLPTGACIQIQSLDMRLWAVGDEMLRCERLFRSDWNFFQPSAS